MQANAQYRLSYVIFGLLLTCATPDLLLAGHHHAPYYDQHFNLNSTRRTSYDGYLPSYNASSTDGFDSIGGCAACMNGTAGGRGHVCPPVQNAILKVWVPDGTRVDVNGHPTKPQTLGGVHKNSRVLSLEGLHVDRLSLCTIVVIVCDEYGNATHYCRDLSVQAGGHYEVRFPQDFEPMHAPEEHSFGAPILETEIPGSLPLNHSEAIDLGM